MGAPPDFVAQLESNPKVTLLKQVGAHVWYLGINNQKKPFDDKRVRQALNYAVNKDAIVRDVLKGTGSRLARARCCRARGAPSRRSRPIPTIRERAKKLLAEAGLPERLLHHAVGAGVGLGHAVAGGHVHGDPVEPQGGRA